MAMGQKNSQKLKTIIQPYACLSALRCELWCIYVERDLCWGVSAHSIHPVGRRCYVLLIRVSTVMPMSLQTGLFGRRRVEGTDTARSTRESEAAVLQDLAWLGIDYDEGGPFYMLLSSHVIICGSGRKSLYACKL
jgi:hypothetical protein